MPHANATKSTHPLVFVVHNESAVRISISRLLSSVGFDVQSFESAQEFLHSERPDIPGCLVLDVRSLGLSGLDLQHELVKANVDLPIIFVIGHTDIPMLVHAMKAGAVEFLSKPIRDQDLLEAIQHAVDQHRTLRQQRTEVAALRQRYASLTPREREVFPLVTHGLLNKQIAAQLGTSEKTIKIHRGKIMRKMRAESLAELIRFGQRLGIAAF